MSQRKKSAQGSSGKGRSPRPPQALRANRSPGQSSGASNALMQTKYRDLTRKHLDRLLDHLFAEFTGLHFHIAWAPTQDHEWENLTLPTACSVCCRLSGSPLRPGCKSCGPRQLAHALRSDGNGHQFTCHLGVRNCWLPLRLRDVTVGLAYLQALDGHHGQPPARKHPLPAGARVFNRLEFARAARLLRFVVAHVQTASLADLRKADLTSAGHAVLALEREQTRLHKTLQRHLPVTPQVPRRSGPESHPEQLVQRLLESIEQDYAKPITLRSCAAKLGMNAAYLSNLFSHAVGVPFKTYLIEARLAQAKRLLNDPTKNISEVADAVGYASENRFRIAFKKATGLSPKFWRETMQANPPAAN